MFLKVKGTRGGAVGWGTALQALKIAGSIPDGATGVIYWHNPSGRIIVMRSTHPLAEMNTRHISWEVKAAGVVGWQIATFMCRLSWNMGASDF
jgi:hypothetical protein